MDVILKSYDGEVVGETTTHTIANSLSQEQMADLLVDYLNSFKDYRSGINIGEILLKKGTHLTLQASTIRWALGLIIGLSTNNVFIDARNETPVAMGREIKRMLDNGELVKGYMI